ncbi:uncharacterized protein METZ01_LOCUS264002 [marine metagenome]|uniref:Uncharacterized protein n=1 Tax=marine metagenome TaxID=408172 RepID=A0A382JHG7_9ZZZZ
MSVLTPKHPEKNVAAAGSINNGFMSRARFIVAAGFSSHFNRVDVDQEAPG